MNPAPNGPERAELAELLPAPATPELSDDRHRVLKEAFLHELTPVPAPRRRSWLVPVAAAGLTVLVAVVLITTLRPTAPPQPAAAPDRVTVLAGDPAGAGPLLERLATEAAARPAVRIGDSQFVYVHSKVAWRERPGTSTRRQADVPLLDTLHDRELWIPQSGGAGLIRENGTEVRDPEAQPNRQYTGLPVDPGKLLRKIYADTEDSGRSPDAAAFAYVGSALDTGLLPPPVAAALYRAAAEIPDLVLIPDAVDATGRPGTAVARTDDNGERQEWIFDRGTFAYLGTRSYLARDTSSGPAGTLLTTSAIVQRGVVAKAGDQP